MARPQEEKWDHVRALTWNIEHIDTLHVMAFTCVS